MIVVASKELERGPEMGRCSHYLHHAKAKHSPQSSSKAVPDAIKDKVPNPAKEHDNSPSQPIHMPMVEPAPDPPDSADNEMQLAQRVVTYAAEDTPILPDEANVNNEINDRGPQIPAGPVKLHASVEREGSRSWEGSNRAKSPLDYRVPDDSQLQVPMKLLTEGKIMFSISDELPRSESSGDE
jgi:hypothetical protein